MPWNIRRGYRDCSGYAVVKESDGSIAGCHETRTMAVRQIAALEASEAAKSGVSKAMVSEGDFVTFVCHDDEIKIGRVEYVMNNPGTLGIEGSEYALEYMEDDKPLIIRLYEEKDGAWEEEEYLVYHRMSDVMKIDSLMVVQETEVEMVSKADSVRVGQMVSWGSSGGTARGKVKRIIRDGSYNVPDSDFTISGTPDNPAVVIEVYRDGEPTGRMVGHRMDTLRAGKSLSGGVLRKMYSVAQNHPGCQGGWAVIDEDGKLDGCFASKEQADAYAAKENMEEEYEDRIDELKSEMEMKEDMMEQKSIWSSFNPRGIVSRPQVDLFKRDYSTESRRQMAASGQAMPDGSFPIANRTDLRNAIQSVGRASNYNAARRHIIRRARALGATDMLPEDWK